MLLVAVDERAKRFRHLKSSLSLLPKRELSVSEREGNQMRQSQTSSSSGRVALK